MRLNGFVVHGAVTVAVFASGVGAVLAGGGGDGVTLAGPQVLRLIQDAPSALSSYPALTMSIRYTVKVNGHGGTVNESGDMSPDGKSGSFSLHMPGGRGTLSAVVVDNTLYMPAPAGLVAAFGKHWLGLSISAGSSSASTQAPTGSDALGYLQLMPGATGQVQQLGHDKVNGVRTTHYRVTIDVLKAQASTPPQFRHASAEELRQLGVSTLPVDVWLDAQNRIRQQRFTVDSHGLSLDMVLRISGSDKPVQVSAPAASDVHFVGTATELVQDALQG